jgi:hypothetical protein
MEDFFDCLLGLLGALGMTWAAARPQRQPRSPLPRGVGAGPAPTDTRRFAAELRATPGRIAGNGACGVASLYTLQGKKGVNQDAMIFWEVKRKNKEKREKRAIYSLLSCLYFSSHILCCEIPDVLFPTVLDQISPRSKQFCSYSGLVYLTYPVFQIFIRRRSSDSKFYFSVQANLILMLASGNCLITIQQLNFDSNPIYIFDTGCHWMLLVENS